VHQNGAGNSAVCVWHHPGLQRWRKLQSANIEFTMKRLRDPIEADSQS
jgi:hypothetical protein